MEDIRKIIDNNYIKENQFDIITKIITNGQTASESCVEPGMNFYCQHRNTDCTDILSKYEVKIKEALCPKEMEDFYCTYKSININKTFTEFIIGELSKNIINSNEQLIWNSLYNDIFEDGQVKEWYYFPGFNEMPNYTKILYMLNYSSDELKNSKNKILFCSESFFIKIIKELKNYNLYKSDNFLNNGKYIKYNLTLNNYSVTIVPTTGLNSIDALSSKFRGEKLILTTKDNIIIDTDCLNDREHFSIEYNKVYDKFDIDVFYYLNTRYKSSKLIFRCCSYK